MKKKGFTLVELLATLTILGIIMILAVPNITGMLEQQKKAAVKQDATKMMDALKVKLSVREGVRKPSNGKCVVFSLKSLNVSGDIINGPNEKPYLEFDSFIIMKRNGTNYEYYVRLVESKTDNKYYGIEDANYNSIIQNDNSMVKAFSSIIGITESDTAASIRTKNIISSHCSGGVEEFYK